MRADHDSFRIEVRVDAGTVRLRPCGFLDGPAGAVLVETTLSAAEVAGEARLEIDLSEVIGFTADGTRALAECRRAAARAGRALHSVWPTGQIA